MNCTWNYPTHIRFGPGTISCLPRICREAGLTRPLLVTDPGLAALPMVRQALASLEEAGLAAVLFSQVRSNPVGANVEAGLAAYREARHDGVIALGGGSALDTGKTIAFLSGQSRPWRDFENSSDHWKRAKLDGIAPCVAVPTTAGTGSEVGRAAVITDEEARRKVIIFHPRMMPVAVVADPALTVGLPPALTAATGMDALAHCWEAYCAPGCHPMADGIAAEGMRLIKEWLETAFAHGDNLEARGHMLAAASMGAVSFQKGLGAIHSLSHPLGALFDTHHGLTNAVLMPYVMVFNRSAIEPRLHRLASWLGLGADGFEAILAWVVALRQRLGIPHTLTEIGVDDGQIERVCEMALRDPTAPTNPVPLDLPGLRSIFLAALNGRL